MDIERRTVSLSRGLGAIGVRACAVAPGTMGTPLMRSAPDQREAHLVSSIVVPQRVGRPEELAHLVESIVATPDLDGENIRLDGALRLPPR